MRLHLLTSGPDRAMFPPSRQPQGGSCSYVATCPVETGPN